MKFEILKDEKTGEMKLAYNNKEFALNKDSTISFKEDNNIFEVIVKNDKFEQRLNFRKEYQLVSTSTESENTKTTITAGGVTLASTVDIKGNITASNPYTEQFCVKVKKD